MWGRVGNKMQTKAQRGADDGLYVCETAYGPTLLKVHENLKI
jgi:hypothetical protein